MKLVKFEKQNCAPCNSVSTYLDGKGVEYEKVNPYESENDLNFAVKFRVSSVPVTILLDSEGNEITRSNGFKPEELDYLIGKLSQAK